MPGTFPLAADRPEPDSAKGMADAHRPKPVGARVRHHHGLPRSGREMIVPARRRPGGGAPAQSRQMNSASSMSGIPLSRGEEGRWTGE